MPDFVERRRMARLIDRTAKAMTDVARPEKGWIATVRLALGMSAEQVARRKGVSRNAVYQAERSEIDGAVSLKQMEQLAAAMGGRFVYAIVPDAPIEELKYRQAVAMAHADATEEPGAQDWTREERADWIDDRAAELLHDMPPSFWERITPK